MPGPGGDQGMGKSPSEMDEDADIDPRIQMINQNGGGTTTLDAVSDGVNNNQSDNGQDKRPLKGSLGRI